MGGFRREGEERNWRQKYVHLFQRRNRIKSRWHGQGVEVGFLFNEGGNDGVFGADEWPRERDELMLQRTDGSMLEVVPLSETVSSPITSVRAELRPLGGGVQGGTCVVLFWLGLLILCSKGHQLRIWTGEQVLDIWTERRSCEIVV